MKFHVTRRHLFFGTENRWIQIDAGAREVRLYDADPGDGDGTVVPPGPAAAAAAALFALQPKKVYALESIEAIEYESTVAAGLAMPIPPAGQPEVTLKFGQSTKLKALRFHMEDYAALDAFTQAIFQLAPAVQLLVGGQLVALRRTSARGKLKSRSIIDTSASPRAAPKLPQFTMAPTSARGSLMKASAYATMNPSRTGSMMHAGKRMSTMTPSSGFGGGSGGGGAVPKFLQERRDEEAAAAARELLHSKWNTAPPVSPTSQTKPASPAPAFARARKKPGEATTPTTPISSKSASLIYPAGAHSPFARLLHPFAKSIVSKILLLKSVGSAAPLHLRFMLLNQLLQLIVTESTTAEADSATHPTTTRPHQEAYGLIPEMEQLVRAEYARGKESRWKEYEKKLLLAQGATTIADPSSPEALALEASEPELAAALKQVLEALFDLLALAIGDVELTPAITTRLARSHGGDEAAFLAELKVMSRQLLKQQAGLVFPLQRTAPDVSTGSVIKISSNNSKPSTTTPAAQSDQQHSESDAEPVPPPPAPSQTHVDDGNESPCGTPPPPPMRRIGEVPPPLLRKDSKQDIPPPPPPPRNVSSTSPPPTHEPLAEDSDNDLSGSAPPPPPPALLQIEEDADEFLPTWNAVRADSLARARASTVSRPSFSATLFAAAAPCSVHAATPITNSPTASSEFRSSAESSSPPLVQHHLDHCTRARAVVVGSSGQA